MRFTLLSLALSAAIAPVAFAEDMPVMPRFVEETATSGIDSVYGGEWQYMVGGGIAVFDCNGDGFDDMLLAGGASPAKFYVNKSIRGGALRFAAQASGLELDRMTGAYPMDIDSDGTMDVVLLRVGENLVMRGTGNCRFERANEAWGFDGGDAWSTALAATWEHGASWPTMAIGQLVWRRQCWATEPSSNPRNPPSPRAPTTRSEAPAERSRRPGAAKSHTTCRSTFAARDEPIDRSR